MYSNHNTINFMINFIIILIIANQNHFIIHYRFFVLFK